MAKKSRAEKRQARKESLLQRHKAARSQRNIRKAAKQEGRTKRKQQRQDARTGRQELRQLAREDRLKQRLQGRQKQYAQQKDEVNTDMEQEANNQGTDVPTVAANRIEKNPQINESVKRYITARSEVDPEEIEEATGEELANMASQLRSEEIEDIQEPINDEIQEEGDTIEEMFDDFEFYEAALILNEEEYPETFEDYGVISPETWAIVSGAAKGGAEVIAQKRFKKGKKFLGKTETEWKAPTDPNEPTEVIQREAQESYKGNFLKDNIVIIVVAIALLFYFIGKK